MTRSSSSRFRVRRGFTLIELLVAATLTLILTALVVQVFAFVSEGVFNSRANIEMSDRLRNAKNRLSLDLRGVIAPSIPPLGPEMELGYLEYVEGPGCANDGNGDTGFSNDTSYGDRDDILMFTTYTFDEEFIGKNNSSSVGSALVGRSRVAEVAWFLRGSNLYRRVFLVNTTANNWGTCYGQTDLSMRQQMGIYEQNAVAPPPGSDASLSQLTQISSTVVNSLGDLTRRERRSLHQPYKWPYEMIYVNGSNLVTGIARPLLPTTTTSGMNTAGGNISQYSAKYDVQMTLGLPLLVSQCKTSATNATPLSEVRDSTASGPSTFPTTFHQYWMGDGQSNAFLTPIDDNNASGRLREQDDVILTGVVGFDVKAWDPGAPVFRGTPILSGTLAHALSDSNHTLGLIAPGDAAYKSLLDNFINNGMSMSLTSIGAPVSFGAYADLNYMWQQSSNPPINVSRQTAYLNVLADQNSGWEKKLMQSGSLRPRLPRPSFGFATRGRPLSGFPLKAVPRDIDNGGGTAGAANWLAGAVPAVYDTWSRHYEYDGINNDDDDGDDMIDDLDEIRAKLASTSTTPPSADDIDEGSDGIDNNDNGFIDEKPVPLDLNDDNVIDAGEVAAAEAAAERDAPPPFDAPLRGLKITIRVLEKDSKQIREVSVIQDFLPK